MPWLHVYPFENECPGYIGYLTYDFGIHQIGKANETCRNRSGYGNHIYHIHIIHFRFAAIEPERNDQPEGTSMTGQSFIPSTSRKKFNRKYHFPKMIQVISRIIEQAMSQSCPDQDAEKTVKEKRFELLFVYLLITILIVHHYVSKEYSDSPQ